MLNARRPRMRWDGRRWLVVAVQDLRSWVESIRPHHRSPLLIDANLLEVLRVTQRLAEGAPEEERAVDVAYDAVVERDAKAVIIEWFDVSDSEH